MDESVRRQSSAWKYAALPALIVLFLGLYPQINIWLVKGSSWNGAFVVSNYDEVAYSAYVNALLDGRPRKTDPFLGRDDVETESLYSIQIIPAYTIAMIAKALGLSASGAFILLNVLLPVFASIAIFALLHDITKEKLLAGVGVLFVLCFGAAIAFQGELQHWILQNYLCDFFPFLRRYQPGFTFPIFFVFCLLVWRMLTAREQAKGIIFAFASGSVFAILVFSYFFLWTAALAWCACFAILWFVFRKSERRQTAIRSAIVGAIGLAALIPYGLMLTNRPKNMDDTQLLSFTRTPNFGEISVLLGLLAAAVLILLVRKRRLAVNTPALLFTVSLALTPLILFNQQVITGRSLQPVHYELFIANYLTLTTILLTAWLIFSAGTTRTLSSNVKRGFVYIGLAAIVWGAIESTATANRNAAFERMRDDAMPALRYLKEQEALDPPVEGRYETVFTTNLLIADYVSTVTSYRSLWGPHTNSAGGVNHEENKELFYRYLYYSGFDEGHVAKALDDGVFEVKAAFFGGGRALSELDTNAKPITRAEAAAELRNYVKYRNEFDRSKAADPELSYVVVPALAEPNFDKIDRWYERDQGKEFGSFIVYRVKLKP
jgi:hypothetical protein